MTTALRGHEEARPGASERRSVHDHLFWSDPETGLSHIHEHGVSEAERQAADRLQAAQASSGPLARMGL